MREARVTSDDPLAAVRAYYEAFRAQSPAEVNQALGMVLDAAFILESPLLEARIGGPATGPAAFAAAQSAAPFLEHAEIESLYSTADGSAVVALIQFPSPAGLIMQSEHFDIDPHTRRIIRLRSHYDPRKLLALSPPG